MKEQHIQGEKVEPWDKGHDRPPPCTHALTIAHLLPPKKEVRRFYFSEFFDRVWLQQERGLRGAWRFATGVGFVMTVFLCACVAVWQPSERPSSFQTKESTGKEMK